MTPIIFFGYFLTNSSIHSILNLIDWSKDKEDAENILSNPDIEVVTITVTESGYYISENNQLNLTLEIVKDTPFKRIDALGIKYNKFFLSIVKS